MGFDHIDARVPSLAAVEAFYDNLLPALGLSRTRYAHVDPRGDWHGVDASHPANAKEYYEIVEPGGLSSFVGIIEYPAMQPIPTRIAFRVATRSELEAWHPRLVEWGAKKIEWSSEMETYPALFFEDPVGSRLELCCRKPAA